MKFKRMNAYDRELLAEKEKLRDISNWTSYLKTASMHYKHSFDTQVAIHGTNPDATACADADFWNKRECMINPNAKPIFARVNGKTHRLFDISDVSGQFKTSYWIWSMQDTAFGADFTEAVNSSLSKKYSLENETLEETIYEITLKKAAEKLGEDNALYNVVSESAAFMAIERCCPDMAEMDKENLSVLSHLPIDEIGENVADIAKEVLSEIEQIVKQERIKVINRSMEVEIENELLESENSSRGNVDLGRETEAVSQNIRQVENTGTDNRERMSGISEQNQRMETGRDTILENSSPTASESKIIGNTEYKYIPKKSYRKYDNDIADRIIPLLEKSDIKYSGKVTAENTTFTVSKTDLSRLEEIAKTAQEEAAIEDDTMPETEIDDEHYPTEKFFKNPDTQSVTWEYYNPNGNDGNGQFVSILIYDDDIKAALEFGDKDKSSFVDYINTNCKTEIIDRGTDDFESFREHFKNDKADFEVDVNGGTGEIYDFLTGYYNELQRSSAKSESKNVHGTYEIYQIKSGEHYRYIRFESLENNKNASLTMADYDLVYSGELSDFPAEGMLEAIYTKFNIDHPEDFKGHSLSMSDVIVTVVDGERNAFYCDAVGFNEFPDFFKEKEKEKTAKEPFTSENFIDMFIESAVKNNTLINAYKNSDTENFKLEVDTAVRKLLYNKIISDEKILENYNVIGFTKSFQDSKEFVDDINTRCFDKLQAAFEKEYSPVANERVDKGFITMRKVGDFYEFYDKDAETAAKILDLHLASKNDKPMVGFPDFMKDSCSDKLRKAGYAVLEEQSFEINPPKVSALGKAKDLINEFSENEYGDEVDFSDLKKVHLAYTTHSDTEREIQSTADLKEYKITTYYDNRPIRTEQYKSLEDMVDNGLTGLTFDDLVYVPDEFIEKSSDKENLSDMQEEQFSLFGDTVPLL